MMMRSLNTGDEFSFPSELYRHPWDSAYVFIPENDHDRKMLDRFGYAAFERKLNTSKDDLTNAVESAHEIPRPEPLLEQCRFSMDTAIERWLKKVGIEWHTEDGLSFFLVTNDTPADVLKMRIDGNGLAEPCPTDEIQNITDKFYPLCVNEEEAEKLRKSFGHVSIRNMMKISSIVRQQRQDEEDLAHRLHFSRVERFAAAMRNTPAESDHVD